MKVQMEFVVDAKLALLPHYLRVVDLGDLVVVVVGVNACFLM